MQDLAPVSSRRTTCFCEAIPLEASVVCLADAWDAMTTIRTYEERLSVTEARAEIVRCSGAHFRPEVVRALVAALDRDPQLATASAHAPREPRRKLRIAIRSTLIPSTSEPAVTGDA